MARPYTLLSLIWGLAIFFASTTALTPRTPWLFQQEDKLFHALEYAILAFLAYRSFKHSSEITVVQRAGFLTLVICIAYGGALELYQAFLPWRSCSLLDFISNIAGITAALFLTRKSYG